MTPKPGSHLELVEPLQNFLENLSQELTEQKFIPAFRDELARLIGAIDNLQRSEETLQQIARGVDRLREVFGPAGTRLLEGVKELEMAMKANAADIQERAGGVVADLLSTHSQLEQALRGETELMQEQNAASRDAIGRVTSEMEARLQALSGQMDSLFRKLESESEQLAVTAPRSPEPVIREIIQQQVPAGPVSLEMSEDVRNALTRTETTVVEELRRYRKEIGERLSRDSEDRGELLDKLDRTINAVMGDVGTKVRGDLDQVVSRLRDQIQVLVTAQVEARGSIAAAQSSSHEGTPVPQISPELVTASMSASENRIVNQIDALRDSQGQELSGVQRAMSELERNLTEVMRKHSERMNSDSVQIYESIAQLDSILRELRDSDRANRERMAGNQAALEALTAEQREQGRLLSDAQLQSLRLLETENRQLTEKIDDDRQQFAQLGAALARAEQAATSATELALSDGRAQREKIENGLRDVRERIERSLSADFEKTQQTLHQISEVWLETLESLREFIHKTMNERMEEVLTRTAGIESRIGDVDKDRGQFQRDLQSLIGHSSKRFDEQLEALRSSSASFTAAMESHVKAVSSDVAALRAKQDSALAVLREAIRANYDDNAARLKTVIDGATDAFIKQIATVPQALDRYAHLYQSLHQGDQIALNAISSDTQNLLSLSKEKLELLLADNAATKKYYPILDKRMEKHATDIEAVRTSIKHIDGGFEEMRQSFAHVRTETETRTETLCERIEAFDAATAAKFDAGREAANRVATELKALQAEELPAFRRELASLLASKFEFMENTLNERGQTLRNEMNQSLAEQKLENHKVFTMLALLAALGIAVQFALRWLPLTGAGK
ncbi:hypothetical protein HZB60_09970 [candidate division KSB1 bacterium]|nr:hypothetical protein [candidate division KSB1 bacterium]